MKTLSTLIAASFITALVSTSALAHDRRGHHHHGNGGAIALTIFGALLGAAIASGGNRGHRHPPHNSYSHHHCDTHYKQVWDPHIGYSPQPFSYCYDHIHTNHGHHSH